MIRENILTLHKVKIVYPNQTLILHQILALEEKNWIFNVIGMLAQVAMILKVTLLENSQLKPYLAKEENNKGNSKTGETQALKNKKERKDKITARMEKAVKMIIAHSDIHHPRKIKASIKNKKLANQSFRRLIIS